MSSSSRVGLAAELILSAQALLRGLNVLTPLGNHLEYDVILSNGTTHFKVQVKSSARVDNRYSFNTTKSRGNKDRKGKSKGGAAYTAGSFDLYALFLNDINEWAFIPQSAVKTTAVKLTRKGKYERYINNWQIFQAKGD